MVKTDDYLRRKLAERTAENAFRSLSKPGEGIDFCSNDYLGLAKMRLPLPADLSHGSTGSRLISGNSEPIEAFEHFLVQFHGAEAALVFNSGFDANLGLLSCIADRHDTILYDQLAHASIRDGLQLSTARTFSFRHNDVKHLEKKIRRGTGRLFVVVESIYSMDGDEAPLEEIAAVCRQYEAALIVDEAHAMGVFGEQGRGLVPAKQLETSVWARVVTFGKALGSHGAAVLGSQLLRDYLINFARPFMYTTALPEMSISHTRQAYREMMRTNVISRLHQNIHFFKNSLTESLRAKLIPSRSAIQCLIHPGNEAVKALASEIQASGYDVRPILHPTVPKGQERLRICLHSFNTKEEIAGLTNILHSIDFQSFPKLGKSKTV